jgi:hypothetical protein
MMTRTGGWLLGSVLALGLFAGQAGAKEYCSAQVSNSNPNLGDALVYTVEVMTAGEKQFSPDVTLPDLASLFQVRDTYTRSAVNILNGRTHVVHFKEVHLVATHTGDLTIPPASVEMIDPASNQRVVVKTNPVLLRVNEATGTKALPTPTAEIDVLRPIKKNAKISPVQWSPFALGGGLLVVVFSLFYYLRTRPRTPPPPPSEPVDPRTPEERAYEALEAAMALKVEGRINDFYTALSSILRRFMSETFGFKAEEATTREMLYAMEQLGFKPQFLQRYRQYFLECDQVKFANVLPETKTVETVAPRAKELIEEKDKVEPPVVPTVSPEDQPPDLPSPPS